MKGVEPATFPAGAQAWPAHTHRAGLLAGPLARFYAPEFAGRPSPIAGYASKLDLAEALTRITMPFLTVIALAAVALLGGGIVLFGRDSAGKPGPARVAPATMAPETSRPPGDVDPGRADVSVAAPAGEAEMPLVLRHFVRKGQVRLFVNDALVLDTEIRAQQAKKIVTVTIREGRYTQTFLVPAGKHEIRVEVDWDEHRRVLHTFANFTEGSVRTLDLELVRLTRELEGSWR